MALAYLFDPNKQFQDRNGVNNVSGFLRVYYEGTDDRATTYKNFIGTLNPADIPIDNDGRAVVIVDEEKTYRIEVYERNGNLQWTQHPVFPQGCGGSEYDGDVSNATATFTKDDGDTSELSSGSTLKVLFTKISKFFAGLKRVAFTGSYSDLEDTPTIPAPQVQSDWNEADNTKADYIKNKPSLASVATSGSYNDLIGKPSIPAAQVNSDWNASSGVAQILNKPDLSQYIQSSQKGAASGVGTLDANGVQPYSETYKGYYNSTDTSSKVIKIGRFKTGSDTRDAGGVSFSIVYRGPTDKSSGQILVWLSTQNVNTSTKCYKTVLFNRGAGIDDNIIKVYTHSVTESSVNYVDLYATIGTWCSVRIVPLWGNPDTWTPVFTTASLPSGATEVSNTIFVKSAGAAGSESVPVHIDAAGNVVPCTLATVASTGSYNDLSGKPTIPEVDQTYNAASTNPQSGVALARHMIRPIILTGAPTGLSHTETFSSSIPQYFDWTSGNYNINPNVLYIADFIVQASGYKNTSVNIEIWAKKTGGKTWIGKLSVPLCRGVGYGQIILHRDDGIAFEFSVDIETNDFSVGDEITVIPSFNVG